ncbi:hypothetical protein BTA51_16010 [Hahella sp. CCB-MM4]|uniref:hypothetical protein n=1 Tax=Hahella sp. (strain CCB-MM4) TaxID=1926491 RepID=UPI000B9BDA6E|nr:hypothetical protein [Hahella sp. CCB-MM4]OZG72245.1 hypothetical protein BTA51_16010 [Hahella sp. CCB-MM4]
MKYLDAVTVKQRFCGPPGSGNGGYVSGLLSRYCGDAAEIRLMAPPPLDLELEVWQSEDGAVQLRNGEQVIATGQPAAGLELEVPSVIPYAEALAASERFIGHYKHPFPDCFVCGTARLPGDGLRIFPGRDSRHDLVAASWIPDQTLTDDQGDIPTEMLWAALDCTGAYALDFGPEKVLLLGSFNGKVNHLPKAGEECVVLGWSLGIDGRKNYAGTALYDSQGRLCGAAKATWIELKPTHAETLQRKQGLINTPETV